MSERIIELIDMECEDIKALLIAKNRAYGNSFQSPIKIFSSLDARERIKVRLDDKLSRLANGIDTDNVPEDTVLDVIGYLILWRVLDRAEDETV
jgi:hypothetical protein